ncbi:hypothetical protein C900_01964 [Fulvivirga imtechensis AK7]|uniref:Uncharacterized protein n=1 Tax=Fulvivirga imtechensis AK7 TaxID=1237149 RepID=L8JWH6_9BACT|nr:hypothetical protein C900_01964 [Fulvivirga imtechensis AK7]
MLNIEAVKKSPEDLAPGDFLLSIVGFNCCQGSRIIYVNELHIDQFPK